MDFVDEFYPIVRAVILEPAFDESDFTRVMKQQQNFVDQVVRASSDEDYSKYALEDLLFRGGNMQHLKQGTSHSVAVAKPSCCKRPITAYTCATFSG